MNDRVRTNSPTPTEKLALKTANAALLASSDAYCDMVATVVFALGSAQLLQSPETAAELSMLRTRVAELKTERHATNEWVTDAAEALRIARDTIAKLSGPHHRATDGELAEQRHLVDPLDHVLEALAPRNLRAAGGVL
ncbi:hypothetical protein [Streptomyces sp. NPDC056543]|uniref:hypothetical protein n=1 Tax=unclassified Streptomyces TaxID=2593676 RepID=UPI003688B319